MCICRVVKDIEFGNITNMDELQSAIDNIEYQGGYTATSPALQAANEILDSEGNYNKPLLAYTIMY